MPLFEFLPLTFGYRRAPVQTPNILLAKDLSEPRQVTESGACGRCPSLKEPSLCCFKGIQKENRYSFVLGKQDVVNTWTFRGSNILGDGQKILFSSLALQNAFRATKKPVVIFFCAVVGKFRPLVGNVRLLVGNFRL